MAAKTLNVLEFLYFQSSGGRYINSRISPTWDNSKSRRFYWSLSRSADLTANKNDVI